MRNLSFGCRNVLAISARSWSTIREMESIRVAAFSLFSPYFSPHASRISRKEIASRLLTVKIVVWCNFFLWVKSDVSPSLRKNHFRDFNTNPLLYRTFPLLNKSNNDSYNVLSSKIKSFAKKIFFTLFNPLLLHHNHIFSYLYHIVPEVNRTSVSLLSYAFFNIFYNE